MRQLRYLEPLIIIAWALIVMTPYRDLNPAIFPDNGSWGEFMSATQGNVAWVHFRECGLCFLWNGSINGGAPAFADPYSSIAHPFAAATYFAFGAVNGGKLLTILAVALGALAVWWLGYELRASPVARLWAGCMAVVSGHMIGRLSLGIPGVILATASASLLFPAYLRLKERNDNLSTVLLAVAVWLTATSGQGYVQIGICAVFALWVILQGRIPGRAIGAGLVGLLLSGWFLIPFVSFLPHFAKDVTLDAGWGQPLEHMLLNLVVRDLSYYGTEFMHKLPYPWIYYNYVGWIPLTLAAFGLRRRRGPRPGPDRCRRDCHCQQRNFSVASLATRDPRASRPSPRLSADRYDCHSTSARPCRPGPRCRPATAASTSLSSSHRRYRYGLRQRR